MSRYKYSEDEQQINNVLKHHDEVLSEIHFPSSVEADELTATAEELLRKLGYQPEVLKGLAPVAQKKKTMVIPTWREVCENAERAVGNHCELDDLFTE